MGGTETILLVEDDESVRVLAGTILPRLDYHVLEAEGGGDALLICEQHAAEITDAPLDLTRIDAAERA